MEINSRIFGKIEIDDNKIITIPNGLLGFEKYTRYVIAYDSDKESKNGIMWLQCVDEPRIKMLQPFILRKLSSIPINLNSLIRQLRNIITL